MNKVYSTNSTIFKNNLDWKVNDLCALFIKKFGNWYRGKILKLNTIKRTATVSFLHMFLDNFKFDFLCVKSITNSLSVNIVCGYYTGTMVHF